MRKKLFTRRRAFVRQPPLVVGVLAAILIGLYGLSVIADGGRTPDSVVAGEAYAIDGDTLRIGDTTRVTFLFIGTSTTLAAMVILFIRMALAPALRN